MLHGLGFLLLLAGALFYAFAHARDRSITSAFIALWLLICALSAAIEMRLGELEQMVATAGTRVEPK